MRSGTARPKVRSVWDHRSWEGFFAGGAVPGDIRVAGGAVLWNIREGIGGNGHLLAGIGIGGGAVMVGGSVPGTTGGMTARWSM